MAAQTTLGTSIGRYRIARLLGGGEVGRVFACKAPESEQLVAIKILRTKHAALSDVLMKSRMQLERIESPHVARIRDVAMYNNVALVVMELVEGESVHELLKKGPLRTADALALARGVVLGLQAAWAHGVAHGDLRPANLLLPHGEVRAVKLVDFLLAAPVEGTEAVRGAPPYLAPELLLGTPPDALTDLYALGCLLTEVLTGKPPFTGSAASVLQAHSSTPVTTLARTMPGAPQGLVDLVDRLLEKDRAKRVKTHGEALAGIERALLGQGMAAPKGPDLPEFLDVDVEVEGDYDADRTDQFHTSPARENAPSDEDPVPSRRPAPAAAPLPVDDIGVYRSSSKEAPDDERTQLRAGIAPPIPSADDLGLVLTPVLPGKK